MHANENSRSGFVKVWYFVGWAMLDAVRKKRSRRFVIIFTILRLTLFIALLIALCDAAPKKKRKCTTKKLRFVILVS